MMSYGNDLDLSFLHCQMINMKITYILNLVLKHVKLEDITCIYHDSIGFN